MVRRLPKCLAHLDLLPQAPTRGDGLSSLAGEPLGSKRLFGVPVRPIITISDSFLMARGVTFAPKRRSLQIIT